MGLCTFLVNLCLSITFFCIEIHSSGGGVDDKFVSNAILRYDDALQKWENVANLKVGRYNHAVSVVNINEIKEYQV